MMRGRFSTRTGRMALGGILTAGSLAILWLACMVPSGQIGVTAVAGLFPVVMVLQVGRSGALLCWAATSLLALLLLPSKSIALLYLCFMGIYPILKSLLEMKVGSVAEWLGKLVFFNVVLFLLWRMAGALLLAQLPDWMTSKTLLLHGAGSVVFLVYDVALSRLIYGLSGRLRQ